MASLQAHLLDAVLRVQIKRRLKNNTDLGSVRRILGAAALPRPAGVSIVPETVGIAGERVEAEGARLARPTLLYLHGGGYFACSAETHRPITGAYARHGFSVFVPEYRLAPEHPYPAALDDAETAWNALVAAGTAPERIVLSGDSAGGGLCLALMLRLRDKGAALPAAAALFSPWTDLAATGPSIAANAGWEAMFWSPGIAAGAQHYIGRGDPRDPGISPLYADPRGLPPLLIHVGEREALRDDSTRFAERARAAGVTVELRVWPVVPHVWQLAQHMVPEAKESLDLAQAFLRAHIKEAAHV